MTATATALTHHELDFDPILDAPQRPQLRLIAGGGSDGFVPEPATSVSIEVYRRRRFLALLAVTVLTLAIAWASGVSVTSFGPATPGPELDAQPIVHTVVPGDSYGAIATELGAANAVDGAALLRASNGGGELVVGQQLIIDPADLSLG